MEGGWNLFREEIPAPRLSAWLFAAMVPPLIQLSCGSSWALLLLAGIACLLLGKLRKDTELPNWSKLPGVLLTAVLLGELAALSADSWPVGDSFPAVPLILLALGAWSALKGPQAAAGVGAVLFLFIFIMYMLLFAAGVGQIRLEWIRPTKTLVDPMCLTVLLLPLASVPAKGKVGGRLALGLIVAVLAVALTHGILSPGVAQQADHPFYEMSRSLELLGVARRFEAVTGAAFTAGWFLLISYLLCAAGRLVGRVGVWAAAAGAAIWVLCGLHISGWILAMLWAVFWVGLPRIAQGLGKIKKS